MKDERAHLPASFVTTSPANQVELTVAARPDMAVLARMTAAAIAARAEFDLDQVQDLRLAIDELFVTLIGEDGADGRLVVTFSWTDDAIRVTGTLHSPARAHGGAVPGGLSQQILDALVEEHGSDTTAPEPCMWFVMRRRGDR